MGTAVLISIRPEWCEKIASGEKTVEVRKTRPKIETPFKCYIYCTQYKPKVYFYPAKGKGFYANGELKKGFFTGCVIGEFLCDRIERHDLPYPAYQRELDPMLLKGACLTYTELHNYVGSGNRFYGLHISELTIYDKPKELGEFWRSPCERVSDCGTCCKFDRANFACTRVPIVTRPPQSWCYVDDYAE